MEWFLEIVGFVGWSYSQVKDFALGVGPEMWVSLIAITVAIWTGRQSQQHAGLSVIPAFSAWTDYPLGDNQEVVLTISNKGFGPAIIVSMDAFYAGKPVQGYMFEQISSAIEMAFCDDLIDIPEASSDEQGHAFGASEDRVLARFYISEDLVMQGIEAIGERMRPLTLSIKYKDIYGRKWVYLVEEFVGKTWRRNSPAHLVNFFRYRRYL